jgi:hypothetical protein
MPFLFAYWRRTVMDTGNPLCASPVNTGSCQASCQPYDSPFEGRFGEVLKRCGKRLPLLLPAF